MTKDNQGSCNSSDKEKMENKTACDSTKPENKNKQMTEEEKRQAEKTNPQTVAHKHGGSCSH